MAGLAFLLQAFLGSSVMIDTFGAAGLRGQERRLNKDRQVMIQRVGREEGLSVLEAKSETHAAGQDAKQASWRAEIEKSVSINTSGGTAEAETGTGLAVGEPGVDVHVEVIILPAPADDEEPAVAATQRVEGIGSGATRGATGMEEPQASGVSPTTAEVLTDQLPLADKTAPPASPRPAAGVGTKAPRVEHGLCGITTSANEKQLAQDCVENLASDGYTQRNVLAADAFGTDDIIKSVAAEEVSRPPTAKEVAAGSVLYQMTLHTSAGRTGKIIITVDKRLGADHRFEVKMGSGDECVVDGTIQQGGTTDTCAIALIHYGKATA